jgi:sugar-specific transcriptional regulator TrmB
MKQDVTEYLERLGISELEAKIYISLLKNGAINARELVLTAKVPRTTVYYGLNLLIEKGLVTKLESGTQTLFEANQPNEILPYLVQQKVQAGKEVADSLPLMLDTLTSMTPGQSAKTRREVEIKYVKGKPGVRKIYEEALQATELRSYVNITEIEKVFPENKQLFDEAIRRNPDIQMFEIVEDSPEARKRFATSEVTERYFYKYFPKNINLTAQDILIFDNTVAIIHFKDTISGVVHRDADLYNNFKVLFDYIWQTLPNVQAGGKRQE